MLVELFDDQQDGGLARAGSPGDQDHVINGRRVAARRDAVDVVESSLQPCCCQHRARACFDIGLVEVLNIEDVLLDKPDGCIDGLPGPIGYARMRDPHGCNSTGQMSGEAIGVRGQIGRQSGRGGARADSSAVKIREESCLGLTAEQDPAQGQGWR